MLILAAAVPAALAPSAAVGAAASAGMSYVALGDSFTAGPLIPPPDPAPPPGCLRSSSNYPHLLATRYQLSDFKDVSCSSATTTRMFYPQNVEPGQNPPQLDAVTAGTGLVTLQISGNDIGFSEIVINCVALLPVGTPCQDRYASGGVDTIGARIQATRSKVDAVLAAIKTKAPDASVFVIGYPSLLPENSPGCWPVMPYTAGDLPYLIGIEKQLNDMLSQAAAATGATYVDLYGPSLGRDACALPAERWVEPVVLPVLGAAVHPNLLGVTGMEAVIAGAIEAAP